MNRAPQRFLMRHQQLQDGRYIALPSGPFGLASGIVFQAEGERGFSHNLAEHDREIALIAESDF